MKQAVSMRLDPQLLARARKLAEQEHRTLTNFIESILKDRVESTRPAGRNRARSTAGGKKAKLDAI